MKAIITTYYYLLLHSQCMASLRPVYGQFTASL